MNKNDKHIVTINEFKCYLTELKGVAVVSCCQSFYFLYLRIGWIPCALGCKLIYPCGG